MKALFDASSIFEAAKLADVSRLAGECTVGLAAYELGNILWKHSTVTGKLGPEEAEDARLALNRVLGLMELRSYEGVEEETLRVACEMKVSYYDAVYLQAARLLGVELVSEDRRMNEAAKRLGLRVQSVSSLSQ